MSPCFTHYVVWKSLEKVIDDMVHHAFTIGILSICWICSSTWSSGSSAPSGGCSQYCLASGPLPGQTLKPYSTHSKNWALAPVPLTL